MVWRLILVLAIGVGCGLPGIPTADAGVIHAVIDKAKAKPDGLHAMIQAKKHELKVAKARKKAQRESGGCCK
ncbi:MAG: hypothetical protein U0795_16025 [Pirellulales bacterium]